MGPSAQQEVAIGHAGYSRDMVEPTMTISQSTGRLVLSIDKESQNPCVGRFPTRAGFVVLWWQSSFEERKTLHASAQRCSKAKDTGSANRRLRSAYSQDSWSFIAGGAKGVRGNADLGGECGRLGRNCVEQYLVGRFLAQSDCAAMRQ